MTENGLASKKRSVSAKFPIANGLIITVKIMLMTMMMIIMIITIEKGEAYHLVPKSILLLKIRVIWKVNTIYFVYLYLYFICHTTITKKIEKEVARRPNRNYRSL